MALSVDEENFRKYLPELRNIAGGITADDAVLSVNSAGSGTQYFLLAFATKRERSQTFVLTPFMVEKLREILNR